MLDIKSTVLPSIKVFINDEIFVDQILPYNETRLTPHVSEDIKKILIFNTGNSAFTVNGHNIHPKQHKQFKI